MRKNAKRRGDKFRQRIAFNIAKRALLGNKHNPLDMQINDFMLALQQTDLADISGDTDLSERTYIYGWQGGKRSNLKTRSALETLVNTNQKNLSDQNKLIEEDKKLHFRNAPDPERDWKNRLVNEDGVTVGYLPGIELSPSKWIAREASKDILHAHIEAIDQLGMRYTSDSIKSCFEKLYHLHSRWDPDGGSYFYEVLVNPYDTDFQNIEMSDGVLEFSEPDCFVHIFDYYSPAKISEYLVSIPLFKDISKHPLLDFWIIDYATSVLLFYWLMYSRRMKKYMGTIPNCAHKAREKVGAGKSLFWEVNGIGTALSYLSIYATKNSHYERYYENFSLYSRRYEEILNSFGITKSEISGELADFSKRNTERVITA